MSRLVLPAAGYERPTRRLGDEGLVVSVFGVDGREAGPFDFSVAPAHGLMRGEVVAAFESLTGQDGGWRSKGTVKAGFTVALGFLRSLDRLGIARNSLREFGPEDWWTWRADKEAQTRWPGQVNMARVLLRAVPGLPDLTVRALAQRTHKPRQRSYGSYTPAEFDRIRAAAAGMVRRSVSRIRDNSDALRAYRAGAEPTDAPRVRIDNTWWTCGQMLDRLAEVGRLSFRDTRSCIRGRVESVLPTAGLHPTYALFPTREEILSLMVLLVCDRGYNLSTMESMTVPDTVSGVGEPVVFAEHLDKPRRGSHRFFSDTYTGASSTIIGQALTMTTPARDCVATLGFPTDRLFIAGSRCGLTGHPTGMFTVESFTQGGSVRHWEQITGLTADDGFPLRLNLKRLRLSEQVINRKASQNSDAVSEDVYRKPDALTGRLVEDVILQGQRDAVEHASSTMKMRYARSGADLGLPTPTATALDAGRLDTAVGACSDHTHSPYSPAGSVCQASFLLCLACPNAVATPAHLPRLLTLHEALRNLRSVNPVRFERVYREHFDRLDHLLTTQISAGDRQAAMTAVSDLDRSLVERLLGREFDA